MARRRANDREASRAYQREFYRKNKADQQAYQKKMRDRRFFWNKSNRLRGKDKASFKELALLWKKQRGVCALTGQRLNRENVELDHKIPKSRGGQDSIENLQWVTHEVNRAKRNLTEEEFLSLCSSCMEWVGQRIQMVSELEGEA